MTTDCRARTITTCRLVLRRPRPTDLPNIHAIMSNAEAMRFWSTAPHATMDETRAWFRSMLEADKRGQSDEFVIEFEERVVGKVGMWRAPEIGFYLHPDVWGLGLASEAVSAFMAYAAEGGFVALKADVDPLNLACLRVLEKCGFRITGARRGTYLIAGQAHDSVYLECPLRPVTTLNSIGVTNEASPPSSVDRSCRIGARRS